MHSSQGPPRLDTSMLATSPRCSLSCNGLSMHLPPLGERPSYGSNYISPPMSASYTQTRFDDPLLSPISNGPVSMPRTSSQIATGKSVSTHSSSSHGGRSAGKENKRDSKNTTGLGSAQVSHIPGFAGRRGPSDWAEEFSPTIQDSPEGQLIPGPPGIARRAKAHVPSACVNCKKKHLACETKRPCNRCVQNGKESSCVDVQHKKRGRPRLREDDSFRELTLASGSSYRDVYQTQAGVLSSSQSGRHRSKTYRELRSQPDTSCLDQRPRTSDTAYHHTPYPAALLDYAASANGVHKSGNVPTVLLTPDFVVAQHNRALTDALLLPMSVRGQTLLDLVIPAERDKIRRLQALMRAEYQSVMQSAKRHGDINNIDTMPSIDHLDVVRATAGFQTRSEYWTFRLPRDQSRGFPICISLARDGGHFVVLTLIQSANPLQSIPSPTLLQHTMMMSGGMPSPPNSLYQSQSSRQQRSSPSDMGMPYLSTAGTYEDQMLPYHQVQSIAPYKQISPPRSVQMPYATPRTNSSSSASVSGSEIPRSSPGMQDQSLQKESLKHLQLPPILTTATPTSDPARPREPQRRRHGTNTPSPARRSPHNGKRKKRRRVEIGDMLH